MIQMKYKKIKLTKGKYAIVDVEDYDFLMQWKWYAKTQKNRDTVYAARTEKSPKSRVFSIHRQLLNAKPGQICDHLNGNGLDNRRKNLRICTYSQNNMNKQKRKRKTSSKYKGVYWHKKQKAWVSRITINTKPIHLGNFKSEYAAQLAYRKAAKEMFGEFARYK